MDELSVLKFKFWDLVIMKNIRNFSSMKYQLLLIMVAVVVYGMFNTIPGTTTTYISDTVGLPLLGGGFISLATARVVARTKLRDDTHSELDTDR